MVRTVQFRKLEEFRVDDPEAALAVFVNGLVQVPMAFEVVESGVVFEHKLRSGDEVIIGLPGSGEARFFRVKTLTAFVPFDTDSIFGRVPF